MAYLTRRQLLAASGAPLLAPPARPNILLILTDQQTHTAVSALGNPYLKTPAMDSLVHGGVSFMQATCPYPVCSPSRAGIFSGLYPHQAEVMRNGLAMKSGIATMGEHFRQAGYRTVYGGKWHLYGKEKGVVRGCSTSSLGKRPWAHAWTRRLLRSAASGCARLHATRS